MNVIGALARIRRHGNSTSHYGGGLWLRPVIKGILAAGGQCFSGTSIFVEGQMHIQLFYVLAILKRMDGPGVQAKSIPGFCI